MKNLFVILIAPIVLASCSSWENKQTPNSSLDNDSSKKREIASSLPSYEESEMYFKNGTAHPLPIWNCYKVMGQVTKNTMGMWGGREQPYIGRIVYTQERDQFTKQKMNVAKIEFPRLLNQNKSIRLNNKTAFEITNQILSAKCVHIENSIKNMICEITTSRGEKVYEYFQNELCATDNRISKDDLL